MEGVVFQPAIACGAIGSIVEEGGFCGGGFTIAAGDVHEFGESFKVHAIRAVSSDEGATQELEIDVGGGVAFFDCVAKEAEVVIDTIHVPTADVVVECCAGGFFDIDRKGRGDGGEVCPAGAVTFIELGDGLIFFGKPLTIGLDHEGGEAAIFDAPASSPDGEVWLVREHVNHDAFFLSHGSKSRGEVTKGRFLPALNVRVTDVVVKKCAPTIVSTRVFVC